MAELFFITHFPVSSGPNPNIVAVDLAKVNDILLRFPPYLSLLAQGQGKLNDIRIICGTGLRHLRTAKALGFVPTQCSPAVGCPDIIMDEMVLLSDGTSVDQYIYSSFADDPEICKHIFQPLANGKKHSIIITDPYLVRMLGAIEPEPGQVFQYVYSGGNLFPHQL